MVNLNSFKLSLPYNIPTSKKYYLEKPEEHYSSMGFSALLLLKGFTHNDMVELGKILVNTLVDIIENKVFNKVDFYLAELKPNELGITLFNEAFLKSDIYREKFEKDGFISNINDYKIYYNVIENNAREYVLYTNLESRIINYNFNMTNKVLVNIKNKKFEWKELQTEIDPLSGR